jgi:hypothetical protein
MTTIAGSVLDVPLGPMFHFPLASLPLNNSNWASALLACSLVFIMIDWDLSRFGIYKIHDFIYLGQYPREESLLKLLDLGVKNILNVSGGNYNDKRFTVFNVPVEDLREMPKDTALLVSRTIKDSVTNERKIFVHCMAGQNRSPGSIYLGLLALGYTGTVAEKMIEDNSLDAVAKHHKIITDRVVSYINDSKT